MRVELIPENDNDHIVLNMPDFKNGIINICNQVINNSLNKFYRDIEKNKR